MDDTEAQTRPLESRFEEAWQRGRVSLGERASRLRDKSWHVGQCSVAAGLAWFLAHDVVGPDPISMQIRAVASDALGLYDQIPVGEVAKR